MGKKTAAVPKEGTKLADLPDPESDDDAEPEIESKELAVLNNILNVRKKSPAEYSTLKYVLFATGIFMLLSLPFIDRVLELALPMSQSWLILVGLKTVIFFIVYYIVFYMNRQ